jgi:hypothetical protein
MEVDMKYYTSSVVLEYLDRAIAGDKHALTLAFIWEDTPQGRQYWANQSIGETPLDIPALKEIRRQYLGEDEPAQDDTDFAGFSFLAAQHGIKITVKIGAIEITYDGVK